MMPVSETEYTAMAPAKEGAPVTRRSVVEDLSKAVSPKWVDACIAGFALALSALLLHLVDQVMGSHALPLFNGGMLTTSIIFFGGPTPPPAKGFAICTIGAWALGFAVRFLMMESVSATCIGAGLLLVYFKMAGGFFPPTLGVAVFLISDQTGAMANPLQALRWLLTPWLAGSAFLYGAAHVAARIRRVVRASLSKAKFKATLGDSSDEKIREAFNRFDTSGDGFLQAGELKYAWQIVTGEEMTDAEAQAMVESVDTDGNNEIDPDEFIALVRENMN